EDIGCPDGVYSVFNIDAKVNAAYVVIGLLYGNGDFKKTMDIAARCGQDADCNPSSAAGILGTILGYNKIPEEWKKNLYEVEDMPFKYTTISLNKVYSIGNKHALENIQRNNGKVNDSTVTIVYQSPVTAKFEESFTGLQPKERTSINKKLSDTLSINFEGNGIVLTGSNRDSWEKITNFSYKVLATIDGKTDTLDLPFNYLTRKYEIYWNYQLPNGKHTLNLKLLNPDKISDVMISDMLVYEPKSKQ
ncbi:MAG: ADP-ribosylglycohydrolase family protein, partial [Sphingobacteriales bacterium]|nr:ADP-ribosylglycohydrolase family protein [Sphingobacteriales bacterium]